MTTKDPSGGQASGFVDWEFAKATGRRLVAAGPKVTPQQAADLVGDLRRAAVQAKEPVAQTARLHAPDGVSPVLVVDRPGWIDANVDSLQAMLEPVIARMASKRSTVAGPVTTAIGSKMTGGESGALMAFLASKILGQYDLAPAGTPRLLLVAPNILQTETEMGVDPWDFRLWVALHEETHRVQFTAVAWLRDHLVAAARELALEMAPDPETLGARLQDIARQLPDVLRGGGSAAGGVSAGGGIAELIATPEQRERMARLTAVMSLLEGHADVVMDDVGPFVIPSVAQIRTKFQRRRQGMGSVDKLLRRLLGLDAKMRQYRDGAAFVRAVTDKVGVDGFNQVWASPETLPSPQEIQDPAQWVARVHA